ncbi:DUF4870 family protein [Ignatzschineria sp. LJL83]
MSHNNQHDHHNDHHEHKKHNHPENQGNQGNQGNILTTNNGKPVGYEDTLIVYILYGLSFFTGFLWFAAIIYAYVRRNDVKDTIYYSHLNYIIRTCWWSLGLSIVAFILMFIFIGIFVFFFVFIWSVYRGIKGFIRFKDGKPMA